MNKIKKWVIVSVLICINSVVNIGAYEAGFEYEPDFEIQAARLVDCLAVVRKSCTALPDLWDETHCKKTADAIVVVLKQQGAITEESTVRSDFHDFENTTMGKKLLGNAEHDERFLFHINICGSGHVFVVEVDKNVRCDTSCCIFQSWQGEFTLPEWLSLKKWRNKKFNTDFVEFGREREISQKQLAGFITQNIAACAERMQRFRSLMVGVPYELEVTSFIVNKQKEKYC